MLDVYNIFRKHNKIRMRNEKVPKFLLEKMVLLGKMLYNKYKNVKGFLNDFLNIYIRWRSLSSKDSFAS